MTKLWRSLRLWFATLPRIHWRWSRPKQVCLFEQIDRGMQVQAELNERIDQIIAEAFEDALQANRATFNARHATPDMLPLRPKTGDLSFNW